MSAVADLQCTMMMPGWESSCERTRRRNAMIGLARIGTPWSGQVV